MATPPYEWAASDVEHLVRTKFRENLELDYKRCAALLESKNKNRDKIKDEVSKDVSAFANSIGGTLVYGIKEDPALKTPEQWDEGFDPSGPVTQEWLEQVINSNIQRRIEGVRVHTVDHPQNSGKVIYIVWVPQSAQAPHMASDHRYYKRHGTISLVMEEYEVRDVSGRQSIPDLRISLDRGTNGNRWQIQNEMFTMLPSVTNHARGIAEHLMITFYLEEPLQFASAALIRLRRVPSEVLPTPFSGQPSRRMNAWRYPLHASSSMPIWEGVIFDLDLPLNIQLKNLSQPFLMACRIDTPRADSKMQWWTMHPDQFVIQAVPYN